MPRDGVQPRATSCKLALDIGYQRRCGSTCGCERRIIIKQQGIDREQPPRFLIGRAPHHHAVHPLEMRERLLDAADAAVEYDRQVRMRRLEAIDTLIVERWDFTVLFRRQPFEPGFP